jgi:5-methylcytosine-specific restriction protein A
MTSFVDEVIIGSRGISDPPKVGESFKDRFEIWELFGGQRQKGIWKFPGEEIVNAYSAEDSPYPDRIDHETGSIEYRGQGLSGNQSLTDGNRYLEDARLSKSPIRFWFKPSRGRLVFKNWAVVTDRTTIFEHDQDDNSAERILWFLAEVGSPNVRDWPVEVIESEVLDLPEKEKPIARNPEKLLARYSQLSQILSQEASESVVAQKTRRTFKRRKDARDLVIARSGEMCENTSCTGMPKDTDKNGRALLEVDHIKPLGEGGPDIPSNMIALCPNCHVAKTRGIRAAAMSKELKKIVEAKEIDLLKA